MAGLSDYIEANYASPSDGDNFLWGGVRYVYDATPGVWIGQLPQPDAVTDAATTMTAPESPNEGDLWYDGTRLNVRTSDTWVEATPQPTADDLGVGPVLVVQQDGSEKTTATTTINFATRTSTTATEPTMNVTATTSNQAKVEFVFPSIPADIPVAPEATNSNQDSILRTDTNGNTEWVDLPDIPTSISDLGDVMLDDIANVNLGSPTSGQVLSYDGSDWVPTTISSGSNVSYDSSSDTLSISGTDYEIPVVTSGAFNASNQLVLSTNGGGSVSIDLSALANGTTEDVAPILRVNNIEDVARIQFSDDFTISGNASQVNIAAPEPNRLTVSEDGTARSTDVKTINFVSGATVSDAGDGNIDVTITSSTSGGGSGEIQTSYSNITQASSLVSSVGQAVNNRSEFTLSGGPGGSRFRTMFRSTTNNATLNWTASPANGVANFTVWGNRTFGLWDNGNSRVSILRAPPNASDILWNSGGNLSLDLNEVLMVEVDLNNNASITFKTSGANDITWDQVEQNTSTDEGSTTTAMVEPVTEADQPAASPPETNSQPYPDSEPNMCGPYWVQNQPDTSENDFIIWDGANGANFRDNATGLAFSPITGGNGSNSASLTNGNSIWGVNQTRHPAGGVFIAQSQTLVDDTGTTQSNVANMLTIMLPHEDDCGVAQYLKDTVTDEDAWKGHPIYVYDRLGGTYGGTSADRRIAAWITDVNGTETAYLNPSTAGVDQTTGALTGTDYPGFINGTAVTTTNSFLNFTSRSIVGQRFVTDSHSGLGGPFGDQLKLNLSFGRSQYNGTLNDFGNVRYSPPNAVSDTFKTQFLTVVPGTTNVLYIEARSASSPIRWIGENHSGNRCHGFEIGYRIFTPNVIGSDLFDVGTNTNGNFLSAHIRQREQIEDLQ